jgi:hypothetical protein
MPGSPRTTRLVDARRERWSALPDDLRGDFLCIIYCGISVHQDEDSLSMGDKTSSQFYLRLHRRFRYLGVQRGFSSLLDHMKDARQACRRALEFSATVLQVFKLTAVAEPASTREILQQRRPWSHRFCWHPGA